MVIKFISTSCTGVFQTFGKFSKTVKPGIKFYIPFLQRIDIVSNRLNQNEFYFEAKTKDNVFTNLDISIQYKIKPENTETAFYSLYNYKKQIKSFVKNVIRSTVPKLTIEEIFNKQDDIALAVKEKLSNKMEGHGYTIEDVLVNDIIPDEKVKKSMNEIKSAQQLQIAATHVAQAEYIKKVKDAEADRDRKILQGEGISGQRTAILKGYEESIETFSKKLQVTPSELIKFVTDVQHLDTLQIIGKSNNAKTLFINHETNATTKSFLQGKE
jgi:regulator of protease activity HflC (stomatin/prohibitin superfamily)